MVTAVLFHVLLLIAEQPQRVDTVSDTTPPLLFHNLGRGSFGCGVVRGYENDYHTCTSTV